MGDNRRTKKGLVNIKYLYNILYVIIGLRDRPRDNLNGLVRKKGIIRTHKK